MRALSVRKRSSAAPYPKTDHSARWANPDSSEQRKARNGVRLCSAAEKRSRPTIPPLQVLRSAGGRPDNTAPEADQTAKREAWASAAYGFGRQGSPQRREAM